MANKNSSVVESILETAGDLHRHGLLDNEEYRQITIRHLGAQALHTARPISSKEIRKLSEKREYEPGSLCPFSQSERRLHLSVGAWGQRAQRAGAGAAECDSPEGV